MFQNVPQNYDKIRTWKKISKSSYFCNLMLQK